MDLQQPSLPARPHVILTCMDPRIQPEALFEIEPGTANLLRNAGGRVTDDVLRSIAVCAALMHTREVLVVHHTGCGMTLFTGDQIAAALRERSGAQDAVDFLTIDDLDRSVREDVARIRGSALVPRDVAVRGFVLDLDTGALRPVS
ncbi:MAG TPA: carbonic anhydrase [Dehalococcoidia bacterium]|nr:carbonic anhydrase [Dehalococcoidia bacterium]